MNDGDGQAWSAMTECPGERLLVLGDHDLGATSRRGRECADELWSGVAIDTDPPLLLTHAALTEVPAGHVNVHGHLHDQWYLPITRHINVTVEQLEYQPARLDQVLALAAELAAGKIPTGRTTRMRIETACRRRSG